MMTSLPSAVRPAAGTRAIAAVEAHFASSIVTAGRFLDPNAAAIAGACRLMADRFARGGSLLVFGVGPQASDAAHVAVEFVHPILVGKRALPAIALTSDAAVLTAVGGDAPDGTFVGPLAALGAESDIALAICAGEASSAVRAALDAAKRRGMLTLLLTGGPAPDTTLADVIFCVPEGDLLIVQEVHETLYHVLWELVHVFLDDREGDLRSFLEDSPDVTTDRAGQLMAQVRDSTRQKCRDICALRDTVRVAHAAAIAEAGRAVAGRIARGGRLLAFGNGGSATDAQDAAVDCMVPAIAGWCRIPALALTNDIGVVTAVANDVGFDHVFSRQVVAFGRRDDVALGISTSGTSRSVVNALREARSRGLLTIALTGYDGGALAGPDAVDFCFVAACDYVPRIQEAHATIWHALLAAAQVELSEPSAGRLT